MASEAAEGDPVGVDGGFPVDAPTAIITLPSLAALVVLALMQLPAAHPVMPREHHASTCDAHGETHKRESTLNANYFRAAAD